MKIAVVGAGTAIGARVIESFHLGEGPTLAALARHPAELTLAARFAIDTRLADFTDPDSLARAFAGCSAVVHAGGLDAAEMKRGAAAVCRAAARANVRRVVYIGSADVHGRCPPPGVTERLALHPQHESAFIRALVAAERQFASDCRQFGLLGYALRPAYLYGPRFRSTARLAAALQHGHAWLWQHGAGICNRCYVDNLVAAVRLALKSKSAAGAAFLVADGDVGTWRDFYHAAAQELEVAPGSIRNLDNDAAVPGDAASAELLERQRCTVRLPILRAVAELGYRAVVPFPEAMRRSCAWWKFASGELAAAA